MEEAMAESDNRLAMRGQLFGLIAALAVLALAGYLAYLGEAAAAAIVAGIDVVGLAAAFIYGSIRKRADRDEDDEDDTFTIE